MSDEYTFHEPFGPEYVRPVAPACPKCPCHTRRVCDGFQWHRAEQPTNPDGTPYDRPCPCEEAVRKPEVRTVAIELDGILREVPAQYHRVGLLAGRLLTDRVFRAESAVAGDCPVPAPMVLYRLMDGTDPRLVVIDSAGVKWVMGFTAQHSLQCYRITGWY